MRAAVSLLALVSLCVLSGCGGSSSGTTTPPGMQATSTVLTVTPASVVTGGTVTLSATVSSTTATPGTPTGTVTFLDGTTTLGTAALANGVASFSTSTLTTGTHSLTASYAVQAGYGTSTSAAVSLIITAAAPAPTTLALMASPNPAAAGAAVTLTANISSAAGVPSGNITFLDGTTTLGSGTLTNGVAIFTTSTLAAGTTHSLTASFAETATFAASTSAAVSLVVSAAAPAVTMTTLTATPSPVIAGASATLTATVTSASGTPTGSVTFYDGVTSIGTGTLANGTASLTTSTLSASTTHSLTAVYPGTSGFATSTSTAVALVVNATINANATFSFATPNQTIMGFGGAEAFYANYLDTHPNESQIVNALFNPVTGLGITFLRLENNYYEYTGTNATTFDTDNTKIVTAVTAALGSAPTILMSSWTPPATLKSNASVNGCTGVTNGNCTSGFGTLAQTGGAYNYAGFGQFWLSSLQAYAALGVTPNYISIQNEPDFPAIYVACLFNPTEAPATLYGSTPTSYASYGKAFDATYQAINASGALTSIPQMIGPESFSLYNVQPLLTEVPPNELAAVAHHLYNVSSYGGNPDTQDTPMATLDANYPNPALKFETEYFQTPGFYNAIDIHKALTEANDNVYLYWGLAWPSTLTNGVSSDQQGLLYIDNPFNAESTWAFPSGWAYNDAYYALKGYSYFIRPGYVRYNATISNPDEAVSVYQSPDGKTTVAVILNTSTTTTDTIGLDLSSITYTNSAVYRSSFSTPITSSTAERWANLGAYSTQGITMLPQSEVTVVLTQ